MDDHQNLLGVDLYFRKMTLAAVGRVDGKNPEWMQGPMNGLGLEVGGGQGPMDRVKVYLLTFILSRCVAFRFRIQ